MIQVIKRVQIQDNVAIRETRRFVVQGYVMVIPELEVRAAICFDMFVVGTMS